MTQEEKLQAENARLLKAFKMLNKSIQDLPLWARAIVASALGLR